jgi:hypothetical protein
MSSNNTKKNNIIKEYIYTKLETIDTHCSLKGKKNCNKSGKSKEVNYYGIIETIVYGIMRGERGRSYVSKRYAYGKNGTL